MLGSVERDLAHSVLDTARNRGATDGGVRLVRLAAFTGATRH
jgi:hypothetical protein